MSDKLEILLHLFIIFTAAKIFAEIFARIKQPIVIGELIAGALIGAHGLGLIGDTHVNDAIAELGVIMLLFMVGLETRMDEMREVGRPAIIVGFFGVMIPLIMGFGLFTLYGYNSIHSLFMGTALVATSIGITARVLGDMGLLKHRTSRIILGAAIVDDILGLLVLAMVSSLATGGFDYVQFSILLVEAVLFVLLLTTVGPRLVGQHLHKFIDRLHIGEAPFAIGLILVLGLSVLAEYIGLAAIIGAFLAGIVLSETSDHLALEEKFLPVSNLLVPVFFVVMGAKFDILALFTPSTAVLLLLTMVVAIASKMIGSAIGTYSLGWRAAFQTGVGMMPRGEVAIIIGTIGISLGIIDQDLYGIILGMSILTTVIAPPLMALAFRADSTVSEPIPVEEPA